MIFDIQESYLENNETDRKRKSREGVKMATSALTSKSEQQSPQHQTPNKTSPSSSSATASNPQQSPRNTATNAMATGTYVSFEPVDVSKALQDGEKFVKWDEVRLNSISFYFFSLFFFFSVCFATLTLSFLQSICKTQYFCDGDTDDWIIQKKK